MPAVIVESSVINTSKNGRKTVRKWAASEKFLLPGDESKSPQDFSLILVFNGLDFYGPTSADVQCSLNSQRNNLLRNIDDALTSVEELHHMCPPHSEFDTVFKSVLSSLEAARHITSSANCAVGTASSAPLLKLVIPSTSSDPSSFQPPTKKRRIFTIPEREDTCTRLGFNQCSCGKEFNDRTTLNEHILLQHESSTPANWQCSWPDCMKSYSSKGVCWKHYRTIHLEKFNYHCTRDNCNFKGCEEEAQFKKHMEDAHQIPTDIRCEKCEKPFSQKNKLMLHVANCTNNIKHFSCDYEGCVKRYRSKQTLYIHKKNAHVAEGETPFLVPCSKCQKVFKSVTAMKHHLKYKHTSDCS